MAFTPDNQHDRLRCTNCREDVLVRIEGNRVTLNHGTLTQLQVAEPPSGQILAGSIHAGLLAITAQCSDYKAKSATPKPTSRRPVRKILL